MIHFPYSVESEKTMLKSRSVWSFALHPKHEAKSKTKVYSTSEGATPSEVPSEEKYSKYSIKYSIAYL